MKLGKMYTNAAKKYEDSAKPIQRTKTNKERDLKAANTNEATP